MPENEMGLTHKTTRRRFMASGLAAAALAPGLSRGGSLAVSSPDGLLTIGFEPGALSWSITWKGRPVLLPSRLGLVVDGLRMPGLKVAGSKRASRNEVWRQVYGERSEVVDRCNELSVELRDENGGGLDIVFRAYNEGPKGNRECDFLKLRRALAEATPWTDELTESIQPKG